MILNAFNLTVAGYLSLQEKKYSSTLPPKLLCKYSWLHSAGCWELRPKELKLWLKTFATHILQQCSGAKSYLW